MTVRIQNMKSWTIDQGDFSNHIIEESQDFILINKPSGMPVQKDKTGDADILSLAEHYTQKPLHILGRLDRPASGIVIMSKTSRFTKSFLGQAKEKKIIKDYVVLVEGQLEGTGVQVKHYLVHDKKKKKSIVCSDQTPNARKALLSYSTIIQLDNYTFLKVRLKTGRFHQIRAQFASLGHPVKGDVKYGARRKNPDRSIYLHAYRLIFDDMGSQREYVSDFPVHPQSLWNLIKSTPGGPEGTSL